MFIIEPRDLTQQPQRLVEPKSLGYIIGEDLGQAQDYTAIAILERMQPAGALVLPNTQYVSFGRGYGGNVGIKQPRTTEYHIRHLERPPLGTLYTQITERTKTLLATPPLTKNTPLVIDQTGVGRAVFDMFNEAGLTPHAITITGGDQVLKDGMRHHKVPKRELVGTLVALFQSGRLKIAEGLEHGPTLINELLNFKVKINLATGHDSYEAWRESVHDDLVLACALACWYGENVRPGGAVPVSWG